MLRIRHHSAATTDGWQLYLKQVQSPAAFDRGLKPVLIVPGYGMNSFIFGFHPNGASMERCLAEAGFEVWSVDLRAMGKARHPQRKAPPPRLRDYARLDLPAALDYISRAGDSARQHIDMIGCSLGGSIAYAHRVLAPDPRVDALVTVGSPLRWLSTNRALQMAFYSPQVAGMLRFSGTPRLARRVLPFASRLPFLLDMYMNTDHVDLDRAADLARTVEDPHPRVNKDIAYWIKNTDMVLAGKNVTEGLANCDSPLLVMTSNRDGIVPEPAALAAVEAWGGRDIETRTVGDDDEWFAHADLFIAESSRERLFDPISNWLHARN